MGRLVRCTLLGQIVGPTLAETNVSKSRDIFVALTFELVDITACNTFVAMHSLLHHFPVLIVLLGILG